MAAPDDLTSWIDKLAIQELITTYFDVVMRGDWETFETLWAIDGVYDRGIQDIHGGSREARDLSRSVGAPEIRRVSAAAVEQLDLFIQVGHGSVVTLHDHDHASARTPFNALARNDDGLHYTHYGIYYDDLLKVDGRWKFEVRRLQPMYFDTSPLPGTVVPSRADDH